MKLARLPVLFCVSLERWWRKLNQSWPLDQVMVVSSGVFSWKVPDGITTNTSWVSRDRRSYTPTCRSFGWSRRRTERNPTREYTSAQCTRLWHEPVRLQPHERQQCTIDPWCNLIPLLLMLNNYFTKSTPRWAISQRGACRRFGCELMKTSMSEILVFTLSKLFHKQIWIMRNVDNLPKQNFS